MEDRSVLHTTHGGGSLAGGIAHEFNNLLAVINGYGELLLSALDDGDPRRSYVVEIGRAADRALALTQQISALDSGSDVAVGPTGATTAPGAPGPGSETLLLVEDNEPLRSLARVALESEGYAVLEARNGTEALEVYAHHSGPIRLLITDVVMPGGGGIALARELQGRKPGLHVLFISGHREQGADEGALQTLKADFLEKPFTLAELTQGVRTLLDAG